MNTPNMQKLIRSENARLRGWKRKLNKKTAVLCQGGPFNGQTIYLTESNPSSARFRVRAFHGRYVDGRWVEEQE